MELTCPYCSRTWEEDPDILRIYLGQGEGSCEYCEKPFYLEATEIECLPCEEE